VLSTVDEYGDDSGFAGNRQPRERNGPQGDTPLQARGTLSMMIQSQPLDMRAARARASSVRGIRPAGSPVFDEVCSPAKEECCKEHCESVLQSTGIRSGDAERGLEGHDGQQ